jgi:hypothetical protein
MRSSKKGLLRDKHRLSPIQLLIFLLVFGVVGILIIKSFAAPNPNLSGDLNNDNVVDGADLSILAANYKTSNAVADVNNDNTVNITDLSIILSQYGQTYTAQKPTPPTGLAAAAGDSQVSLSWTANSIGDTVDSYQVYWTTDSTFASGIQQNLSVIGTNYTVTGLTNGTTYYFRVSAHNSAGYSAWSPVTASATPQGAGGGTGTGSIDILTRFENNLNSDFGGGWGGFQPCIPTNSPSTGYLNPPAREGSYSLMFHTETGCKANGGTSTGSRVSTENHVWPLAPYHDADTGYEFWYGLSVRVPAGQTTDYIFQEWHAGQASVNFQAPWHLGFDSCNGTTCQLRLTLNEGLIDDCGVYDLNANNGWQVQGAYDNIATIPEGQWMDLVWFVRWRNDSTGRIIIYDKTSSSTVFNLGMDSNTSTFHDQHCWQTTQNKIWSNGIPTRAWYPGGTNNTTEQLYPVLLTYPSDTDPPATTFYDMYMRYSSTSPTTPEANPGKSSPGFQAIANKFGGS